MNEAGAGPVRFGDFEFEPDKRRLLRAGQPIPLSATAAAILQELARHSGHEVGVAELCAATRLSPNEVESAGAELAAALGSHFQLDPDGQTLELSADDSLYSFLEELRKRKVFRVATGYAVTGWLLLQIAEIIFPLVDLGAPAMKALLVLIVVGFPVAVAGAWALELTPAGLVLDWRKSRPDSLRGLTFDERKLDRFIIAALMLVIALLVFHSWRDNQEDGSIRVVAVLPFASSGIEGERDSLCEGFAEEIRVGLDRLPGIQVAARDLSATLIPGGKSRNVGWLVEGSCQLVNEALNVKVTLTDAASGTQRWAYSDSRALDELLAFQDDISATLAFELAVPEAAREAGNQAATDNPRAYRIYLQARGYLSRPHQADSLATAAGLFADALHEDEEFALAHAGLCEANLAMYLRSHEADEEKQAESACLRASQLGPGLPEVHIALGRLFLETGDLGAAERALLKALDIKPGSVAATRELANVLAAQNRLAQAESLYRRAIAVPSGSWRAHNDYGRFLLRRGRLNDAAAQFEEVVQLTPDNAPVHNNLGATYLQMGDLSRAAEAFERVAEIEHVASSISNYGTMLYYTGRFAEAEAQFREAAEMSPADHRLRGNVADAVYQIDGRRDEARNEYRRAIELAQERLNISRKDAQAMAAQAWYRARDEDTEQVEALLADALQIAPDDPEIIYYAALIRLQLGDTAQAMQQLRQAAAAGYPGFLLKASPDLKALRDNAEFEALISGTP